MALWPWKPSGFLKPEEEEWQAAAWAWFLRNLGGLEDLRLSPLVTPSAAFFPATTASGHERAQAIFDHVRQHARLPDWECALIEQPSMPGLHLGEGASQVFEEQEPAGTFSIEDGKAVLSYDPALVADPMQLVATFIHELGHYVLATIDEEPPGGEAMHERATDLVTVYLGFGIFGANSAFNLRGHVDAFNQGWRSARLGYLTEPMWSYALAMFFLLREEDPEGAKPFLKDHLFADMRKAAAYLRKHPERMPTLPSS